MEFKNHRAPNYGMGPQSRAGQWPIERGNYPRYRRNNNFLHNELQQSIPNFQFKPSDFPALTNNQQRSGVRQPFFNG